MLNKVNPTRAEVEGALAQMKEEWTRVAKLYREELRPVETEAMGEDNLTLAATMAAETAAMILLRQLDKGTPFLQARDIAEAELRCEPELTNWEQAGAEATQTAMTEMFLNQPQN
jgi:hypothetical protein